MNTRIIKWSLCESPAFWRRWGFCSHGSVLSIASSGAFASSSGMCAASSAAFALNDLKNRGLYMRLIPVGPFTTGCSVYG